MNLMVTAGTASLALGALAGWPLAMLAQGGARANRLRLREPKRLMQVHLDWLMMGILLLALAAAMPGLPNWIALLVVAGAIANPLLFLPLAIGGSTVRGHLAYRIAAAASFTVMSAGLVATAVTAAA
jgi:hypothetical protein